MLASFLSLARLSGVVLGGRMASSTAPLLANRLSKEKSPYLLQHANNPVDWYPWGPEAFAKAKSEGKPIFLSIGYSTCHWCHVMERESFESKEIAQLLNGSFVSVKVDREERPDVDKVYMTFVQATQGGGGWPLSVFLTPDLQPFFGGTYFPPRDSYHGPGFPTLLRKISSKWKSNPNEVAEQGVKIIAALSESLSATSEGSGLPGTGCIQRAYEQLEGRYDKELGGFGRAPKFPQPTILNFLLRLSSRYPESSMGERALEMTLHTLKAMANGGMHDHVGQGFHRYSTDKYWHVPHFEKMLYDQAQLASIYATAFQITRDVFFKEVLQDILLYVSRDLTDEDGGFYSAEDADSYPTAGEKHKREGAFCVWTQEEISSLLSDQMGQDNKRTMAELFCSYYGVEKGGNVKPHQDPHDELKGQNVLIVREPLEKVAGAFGLSEDRAAQMLKECRGKLFEQRLLRPKPHRDNKILTGWNGLMISGFSRASVVLGDVDYLEKAKKAAHFVKRCLYNSDSGTLIRNAYRDTNGDLGVGAVEGFADDYAFLIAGLLDLFEGCHEESWLEWAYLLQQKMTELFWDKKTGGFYSTTEMDASILLRLKEDQDGAEPSPNSCSAGNLQRLHCYFPDKLVEPMASDIFKTFSKMLNDHPVAVPEMLSAFIFNSVSPKQIILAGDVKSDDTKALLDVVNSFYLPNKIVIVHRPGTKSFLSEHLQVLDTVTEVDGKATAYVCENYSCKSPVNQPALLKKLLNPKKSY